MTRRQAREQEDKNLLKTLIYSLLAAVWLAGYCTMNADQMREEQIAAKIEVGPGMAREIGGTR